MMKKILFVAVILTIAGFFATSSLERFSAADADLKPPTYTHIQNDTETLVAYDFLNGTDSSLPAKAIPECKAVDPSKPYSENRLTMNACAKSITPLLRSMRYVNEQANQMDV
jgi:hypothetical protein